MLSRVAFSSSNNTSSLDNMTYIMYVIPMIRTQVYLAAQQHQAIKAKATVTQKLEAEVIREALDRGLPLVQPKKLGNARGLLALAELGQRLNVQAPADLSTHLDDYLYGDTR